MRALKVLRTLIFTLFLAVSATATLPGCASLQAPAVKVAQAAGYLDKAVSLLNLLDQLGVEYVEGLPTGATAEQLGIASDIADRTLEAHEHLLKAKVALRDADVNEAREEVRQALLSMSKMCDALERGGVDVDQPRGILEDLLQTLSQ